MFQFAFTKPSSLTKSQRKNKNKAAVREREREYWAEWSRAWDERRNCLEFTFRIWSGKEKSTMKEKEEMRDWRPSNRWLLVAQGGRAALSEYMKKYYLYCLKKTLHCLSIRDISFDFYNELVIESHKQYDFHQKLIKKKKKEQKQYEFYLDWAPHTNRERKKHSKKILKQK